MLGLGEEEPEEEPDTEKDLVAVLDPVAEGLADLDGRTLSEAELEPVMVGVTDGDAVLEAVLVADKEVDLDGVRLAELLGVGEQMNWIVAVASPMMGLLALLQAAYTKLAFPQNGGLIDASKETYPKVSVKGARLLNTGDCEMRVTLLVLMFPKGRSLAVTLMEATKGGAFRNTSR